MDIKARKDYEEIINGCEGHWFDPGEYEYLKQKWFDTYALQLVETIEKRENAEKDYIKLVI